VRGGRFRLVLAAATALFAVGVALLSHESSGSQAVRATRGEAATGTPAGQAGATRTPILVSRPHVVGPLRNITPQKPVWHGNKPT
jgi:hypothetical protein